MKLWADITNNHRGGKWKALHPYHNVPIDAPGCPAAVTGHALYGPDQAGYGLSFPNEQYRPCDNFVQQPGMFCWQHDPSPAGVARRVEWMNKARQIRAQRKLTRKNP